MTQTEFVGYLMVYGVILLVALITLIKPILSLNTSIQKLTDTLEHLKEDVSQVEKQANGHNTFLQNHEVRISLLEKGEKK